jgi:hypothetical protein
MGDLDRLMALQHRKHYSTQFGETSTVACRTFFSMRKHRNLMDQEANSLHIAESKAWRTAQLEHIKEWRQERTEEIQRIEQRVAAPQVREDMTWLGNPGSQENTLDKLASVPVDNVG